MKKVCLIFVFGILSFVVSFIRFKASIIASICYTTVSIFTFLSNNWFRL